MRNYYLYVRWQEGSLCPGYHEWIKTSGKSKAEIKRHCIANACSPLLILRDDEFQLFAYVTERDLKEEF